MENEIKTFKILLADGSIIGVDASYYDLDPKTRTMYFYEKRYEEGVKNTSVAAMFNLDFIMGITEFEEE